MTKSRTNPGWVSAPGRVVAAVWRRRLALFGSAALLVATAAAGVLAWRPGQENSGREMVSVASSGVDRRVEADLRRTLAEAAPTICTALETPCRFRVALRVFENQDRFDEANPGMRGYFAFSTSGTIQIVSPLEAPRRGMSYEDGLMIVAHEFTHLALNEVNPRLADWIQEGAAVYFGPRRGRDLYDRACRGLSPRALPALTQLTRRYHSVANADLYAYTVFTSLVRRFGEHGINTFLKGTTAAPAALGTSWSAIAGDWRAYVREACPTDNVATGD